MTDIDTADSVLHRPTGEKWLVARVDGDYLYWCGWPPGRANVADCELLRKATDDERDKLLREIANGHGHFREYAQQRLGAGTSHAT